MNFKYESNRVYLEDDNGKVVAEVTFPNVSENVVKIDHTFVDDSLRGQGIAGQLMRATANHIKENDLKAIAECS